MGMTTRLIALFRPPFRPPLPPFGTDPPPSEELVDIALSAASAARSIDLSDIEDRAPRELQKEFVRRWPGEHYRLLRALTLHLSPELVVEVGTLTGLSTLAFAGSGRVVTYDLVAWDSVPDTALREGDFEKMEQRLGDLSDPAVFAREREVLAAADIVFVDAPKDGKFEPAFLALLLPVLKPGALLILDDILFPTMVELWRDLPLPKIDLTAFGHVSGTGLALSQARPG
jgi:predicted O-methyltransferase YrrM